MFQSVNHKFKASVWATFNLSTGYGISYAVHRATSKENFPPDRKSLHCK